MTRFKDILVPTDFGEPSLRALDVAIELGLAFGANLTLVHVYEIPVYTYPGVNFTAVDLPRMIEEAAQQALDKALASARERVPQAKGLLRHGVVWREILASIEYTDADLVVIGTHGRHGVERAVLGSVAEKIVRFSPVPVLTVRHRKR